LIAGGPLVLEKSRAGADSCRSNSGAFRARAIACGSGPRRRGPAAESSPRAAGPFRGRTPRRDGRRDPEKRALGPSDLGHGASSSRPIRPPWSTRRLEVIEAHLLFAIPYERIDVVVHPQVDDPFDGRVHRRCHDRAGVPARHEAAHRNSRSAGPDRVPGAAPAGRLDGGPQTWDVRAPGRQGRSRRSTSPARARRRRGMARPPSTTAANEELVDAFPRRGCGSSSESSTRSATSCTNGSMIDTRRPASQVLSRTSNGPRRGARGRARDIIRGN